MAYPFFMLFSLISLNGQHKAIPPLLNLEFDQVRTIEFNEDERSIYYSNLADILEVLFTENELDYERLRENRSERIERLETSNLDQKWKDFLEAEIKLQWAFLDFRFNEDWDALWGLRSAFKISRDLYEEHPEFQPNLRTQGLLNIIFGTIPSNKQWLLNLFRLKGDVFVGLDQLAQLKDNEDFGLESNLILGMIEIFMLEDFTAGQMRMKSISQNGVLVGYIRALTHLKTHRALEAREILKSISHKAPVLEYFLAETYFQELSFEQASYHFRSFLSRNEGTAYIKDAHLKLGIAAFYQNNLETFQEQLNKTIEFRQERTEIDRNALKLLRSIDAQDSVGLLIRYTVDGGFYEKANSLISYQETRELPPYYALELLYRKARMAHLQKESQLAISLYKKVIQQAGEILETYYAPNSFLQIGYLSQETGNLEDARMYFERVLKFKDHPYKKSLDNKAKLALAKLDLQGE